GERRPMNDDSMASGVIPLARARLMLATVAVMVATAMQAADATIANVALPQLERDLGGGVVLGGWVMTSSLCANALVAPLTGWLSFDFIGIALLAVGVGALQLCLERGVGRSWLHSPELLAETTIALAAGIGIAVQARRGRFSVFRMELFRDVNFATAAFYNFM